MKKILLKSLLAIIVLLGSTNASAYDFEVGGIYYNILSKTDLTCEVTYGASYSYYDNIIIPKEVKYNGNTYSVTSIAVRAFYGCSSLTNLTIEDSNEVLKFSKNSILYSCPIEYLYLGRDLDYERDYLSPFSSNGSIKTLIIGDSVTRIGNSAFQNCDSLESVTIGNSVTEISDWAFSGCRSLKKVIVKDIAAWCNISFSAFAFNLLYSGAHLYSDEETEIKHLVIPNSVTEIGDYAFSSFTGLESVTIPNSVTKIGDDAFSSCRDLESVTIPNSITEIGDYAFSGCSSLPSIEIPNSVTTIGKAAFAHCHSLASIKIPNSVTYIGEYAFYSCLSLASVTIGNSVQEIGEYAFNGCTSLATVYSLNTKPPYFYSTSFDDEHYNNVNLFVPQEVLEIYKSDYLWEKFYNIQGFDATGIESVKSDAIKGKNVYYDLNGNRLDAPKKGLNIINGKKVVVK